MFHQIIGIITLTCLFLLVQSQSEECIADSNSQRVFKSLVDYQGNKITFDSRREGFKGNQISFLDGEINPISKNSFVTKDSEHVRQLNPANHQINLIEDGAFLSLNCVYTLELQKNKIEILTKNVFEGLRHLHELDLTENKIMEIPERIFRFTPVLRKLNISRNSLKVLHSDSFYKLMQLEQLDISYNYLHKIDPDILRYFNNLINLQMGSNQFEYLQLEEWKNLTSLKILNLSNNELRSIDFLYHFSFSSTLTDFYIDDNYLTRFNVLGFRKHLPSVKVIDISENLWLCADLAQILKSFNDSRIDYKGSEKTIPNFGGIACNRTVEEYQNKKWTEPHATTTTTTVAPSSNEKQKTAEAATSLSSLEILESIKSLQTIVICLFVVIALFIFIDFSLKCKRLGRLYRRNNLVLDNSSVEDISLLRGRF